MRADFQDKRDFHPFIQTCLGSRAFNGWTILTRNGALPEWGDSMAFAHTSKV